MSRQVHKGFMFLNDLNLSSDRRKPQLRIDDDYLLNIRKKLQFCADYAIKNELKIIIFGSVFKHNFEYEALKLFVESFKLCNPLIIYNERSDALEFLKIISDFDIKKNEGSVESFSLELKNEIADYDIYYYKKIPKDFNGLESFDLTSEAKGLVISDDYYASEHLFDGIDAIVCGKWESVLSKSKIKAYCPTIIRQGLQDKELVPRALVWIPEWGFESLNLPHIKEVFDDYVSRSFGALEVSDKEDSNFAEKLRLSLESSHCGADLDALVAKFLTSSDSSSFVKKQILSLFSQVT